MAYKMEVMGIEGFLAAIVLRVLPTKRLVDEAPKPARVGRKTVPGDTGPNTPCTGRLMCGIL